MWERGCFPATIPEQLRRPCRPRHPYAVPRTSLQCVCTRRRNCIAQLSPSRRICASDCRFSSPDLARLAMSRSPAPPRVTLSAAVARLPADRKNGAAAPCPLSAGSGKSMCPVWSSRLPWRREAPRGRPGHPDPRTWPREFIPDKATVIAWIEDDRGWYVRAAMEKGDSVGLI